MVAGGASSASPAKGMTQEQASHMLVGDVCLLINTLAMAVYYILAKQLVQRYPAICVAAWAYLVGALRGSSWVCDLWVQLGCGVVCTCCLCRCRSACYLPPCCCLTRQALPCPTMPLCPCPSLPPAATCMGLAAAAFTTPADWHFPRAMVAPLIYWIVVCSVAGYYAVTWAMRHLPASQVQPRCWVVGAHAAQFDVSWTAAQQHSIWCCGGLSACPAACSFGLLRV